MNTFRALKHMLLLAVVLCSLSAVAQSKYDRWGGVYYAYHAPEDAKLTPAPEGFRPFYISHYGRHGSRWLPSDSRYEWVNSQFADNVLNSKGLVLVDFWAEWCGPCRQLGPILETIDSELSDVTIYKMNVDDSPQVASQFGIRSIPTMFLFKDGQQVDTKVGLNTEANIKSWIESHK